MTAAAVAMLEGVAAAARRALLICSLSSALRPPGAIRLLSMSLAGAHMPRSATPDSKRGLTTLLS